MAGFKNKTTDIPSILAVAWLKLLFFYHPNLREFPLTIWGWNPKIFYSLALCPIRTIESRLAPGQDGKMDEVKRAPRNQKSHMPKGSMFFEKVVPVLLAIMGIVMMGLILFAVGVLVGLVNF